MSKKSILFLSLWCFYANWCLAQSTLNVQQYIERRVDQLDNLPASGYSQQQFQAPWIDGIDIRTETDEFNFNRQRYLFRLSPNTPKVRKAQANLHRLYLEKADLKNNELQKDFIDIAYEEVVAFYEAFNKLKIKETLLIVLQDQEKVWRKLSQSSSRVSKDWLEIQEDIAQLQIDIHKEASLLKFWQSEGEWLSWDNLITVEQIGQKLLIKQPNQFHFQTKAYDVENRIIEREEALEQAEQKKIVDFVQIEYAGPHGDELKERVSLTAGFTLPYSASRRLKMEELAIEKESLEQERLAEKQINQYKEKEKRNRLLFLVEELAFTKKQYEQQNRDLLKLAENNSRQQGTSPLFLLYQKETNFKNALALLKLEVSIYQEYIEYLSYTEQLYQSKFSTFLSTE